MAADDPFNRDPSIPHGVAIDITPGVRRITAPNPSPMTFTGTNSYLVGGGDELALIDPGPDDPQHLSTLLSAAGTARIAAILVTHSHVDHSAGTDALRAATGVPVFAFGAHGAGARAELRALMAPLPEPGGGEGADRAFQPDRRLADGESVAGPDWRLTALHTPGHLSNHLCFALEGDAILFSGDVVMGWATTLVSPPDGDMRGFLSSLARLRARPETLYLPAHGHPVHDPAGMIDWQIAHRREREAQIIEALGAGDAAPEALAQRIYAGLDPALLPAAARNVLAHLLLLVEQGRAAIGDGGAFRLT